MKTKNEQIFEEAKEICKRMGLPIVQEDKIENEWRFLTGIVTFLGSPKVKIAVHYEIRSQYLMFSGTLAYPVSEEKVGSLNRIGSRINNRLVSSTLYFDAETRTVMLKSGFYLKGDHVDAEAFEKNLRYLLQTGGKFFGPIHDLLDGTKGEQEILSQIEEIYKGGK